MHKVLCEECSKIFLENTEPVKPKPRPLDRGKVLGLLNKMADADFGEGYAKAQGYYEAIDGLLEAINSGRLDVEEG